MHKILVREYAENTISGVKGELSSTKKVSKSDQVECVEQVVEEHVRESRHSWTFHVLIEVYRTD